MISISCAGVSPVLSSGILDDVDVLSDVVTAMRIGKPHSARVSHRAPFGRRFPAAGAAGFHIVLQGTCWLFPPTGTPIALRPGDIAFLPRGCAHGLADSENGPLVDSQISLRTIQPEKPPTPAPHPASDIVMLCGAYLLDRTRAHPMLENLPGVIHIPAPTTRHTMLGTVIDLLDGELHRDRPGSDAMLRALLDALLLHILRVWFDEQADDRTAGWAVALHDPAVTVALRAIHSEPGHGWTVAELANQAGLSRATFARRFTTLIGQPPVTYLTWWRMTLAARHLRDDNTPLATVARQVGYTSEFAFAHAFKHEFGCAPGQFRRNSRTAALGAHDPEPSVIEHEPAPPNAGQH
ncbi:MAG: AraC family transcriptional regulator [Amycolatopsis sp.]|nr:AraC family transcriptional regulator [Amycolatopsis sp.]